MEDDKRETKQRNTLAFLGRIVLGFSALTLLVILALYFEDALDITDLHTIICVFIIISGIFIGGILTKMYSFEQGPIVLSQGFFMVASAWIIVSLIAAIPFMAVSPEQGRLEPYKA
ncbi:MAG TPA: hypothetical protein ENL09_00335, partial [Bacteroidetes bacterium]|nr:hypothetical protein [Bacteroidota bacterium]